MELLRTQVLLHLTKTLTLVLRISGILAKNFQAHSFIYRFDENFTIFF